MSAREGFSLRRIQHRKSRSTLVKTEQPLILSEDSLMFPKMRRSGQGVLEVGVVLLSVGFHSISRTSLSQTSRDSIGWGS